MLSPYSVKKLWFWQLWNGKRLEERETFRKTTTTHQTNQKTPNKPQNWEDGEYEEFLSLEKYWKWK